METPPQPDKPDDFVVHELSETLRIREETLREEFGDSSVFDRRELVIYTDENGNRRELILPIV